MTATPLPRTTTALLCGLGDPCNQSAWSELVERCAPIMRGVALRTGLDAEDVDDLVQNSLVTFIQAWRRGQYDRSRGRLSAYLVTILRSRIADWRRREGRRAAAAPMRPLGSTSSGPAAPDHATLERFWSEERQRQILTLALGALRVDGVDERSIAAFELYAVRAVDAGEVADRLGMSREDVYNAKYRITRRLQPIVGRLDELYEDL